jgi:hypothetical protein
VIDNKKEQKKLIKPQNCQFTKLWYKSGKQANQQTARNINAVEYQTKNNSVIKIITKIVQLHVKVTKNEGPVSITTIELNPFITIDIIWHNELVSFSNKFGQFLNLL